MSRIGKLKLIALCTLLAAFAARPIGVQAAGSVGATVSITATVDVFAEWDDAAPVVIAGDWDGHVTAVNQTRNVTAALTLYSNGNVTITPTAGANSGILTSGGHTLTTSYKLTGDVTVPDVAYHAAGSAAGQFFDVANTYSITHLAGVGSYAVNLLVKAVSPATAPDSGDYTCGVVVTASW
ncbi:MAG TPA: hypothetical protein VHM90_16395 [Phycisphaerae bacterium]|nr:hypothetical protein [Phycisphaerae bacterium]